MRTVKVFECISKDSAISKFSRNDFFMFVLKLICGYLLRWKPRTKTNSSFSSISSFSRTLFSGIPHWSIMRPIVFNIIIVDLFLVIGELHVASYSNNNNIYCSNDCASDDITLLRLLKIFFCGSKATKWKEAPIHINWFLAKRVMVKPGWFNIS